jgi:hypothetical protein
MRRLVLYALIGCGSDGVSQIEEPLADAPPAPSDVAEPADAPTHDDAGAVGGDAPSDAQLTLCEEATLHSDLAWIEANVFVPRCSGCHGGASPDAGLRLGGGQSRDSLVNVVSTTKGTPWLRVKPGFAQESYVMVAIGAAPGPQSSLGTMPLNSAALCHEIHGAIGRWIDGGAQ